MSPTTNARRRRQRWILVALAVLLASIWYTNINQAVNTRRGCERGKLDRAAQANLAQTMLANFLGTDRTTPSVVTPARRQREQVLRVTISGIRKRSMISCSSAYPLPFPLHL